MEEHVSGFRKRGSWTDVVEHGERISRALRECDVDDDAFVEWEDWRPKSHERMDTDVSEKTAEQASVSKGEGERAGKSPDQDLKTASERLTESYEKLEEDDTDAVMEKWQDSMDYVARAADSAGRKMLRRVENTVYRKVMTQIAPYYFDNELVSANIQRLHRVGDDDPTFQIEVNINDDDLKAEISDKLSEYEDTIDRWHVDTEKAIDTVEAAEGVEVTDRELAATTAEPPSEDVLPDARRPPDDDQDDG